ncbi:MAG: CdaR family protein [Candidatus Muiribacteriota bacterium]
MSFDVTKEVLTKNIGLKLISLIIAFFLWVYVITITDPYVVRKKEVPVNINNLNERLIIKDKPQTVNLSIRGRRRDIISFADSIKAFVDMSNIDEPGVRNIPVEISNSDEFEIVGINPSGLELNIRQIYETVLDIDYQIINRQGYYYEILNNKPETVEVSGNVEDVKKCYMARVNFDLMRLSRGEHSINEEVNILSSDYTVIDNVKTEPDRIELLFKINEYPSEKKLINPVLEGEPASGNVVYGIDVKPSAADIKAHPDLLKNIEAVKTEPVNISGIESSLTKRVRIEENSDYILISEDEVEVTIILRKEDGEE